VVSCKIPWHLGDRGKEEDPFSSDIVKGEVLRKLEECVMEFLYKLMRGTKVPHCR
jgi:hypothetical protein